jgi:uncharacterized protein YutE (UPF0331/DUF86 family)
MLNRMGIRDRLADLKSYLEDLKPIGTLTLEEYKSDSIRRYAIERLMELIIECAIDINGMIITGTRRRPPRDYRSSFLDLVDTGAISSELASSLAPMARLRNMLAHEYETMNDEEIHSYIPVVLDLFSNYLREIQQYIERDEKDEDDTKGRDYSRGVGHQTQTGDI